MRKLLLLHIAMLFTLLLAACEKEEETLKVLDLANPLPVKGMPGDTMTILGRNFNFKPEDVNISMEGTMAKVISVTSGEISFIVPESSAFTCSDLALSPNGYQGLSWQFCLKEYPVPKIESISPSSGAPGSLITITGKNFGATIEQNKVLFATINWDKQQTETVPVAPVYANATMMQVRIPENTAVGSDRQLHILIVVTPDKNRPEYTDGDSYSGFTLTQ